MILKFVLVCAFTGALGYLAVQLIDAIVEHGMD